MKIVEGFTAARALLSRQAPAETPGSDEREQVVRQIIREVRDRGDAARSSEYGQPANGPPLVRRELVEELARQLGYDAKQTGVVISSVEPGSPAATAGLQAGILIEEVNKQGVANLQQLQAALKKSSNPKRILLRVRSGEMSQYVVLVAE